MTACRSTPPPAVRRSPRRADRAGPADRLRRRPARRHGPAVLRARRHRDGARRSRSSTSSRSSSTATSCSGSSSASGAGDGPPADEDALLAHLLAAGRPTSPRPPASTCAVESATDAGAGAAPAGRPHHVIVLGRPVPPDAVAGAARAIAGIGGNIDAIRRLSDYPVTSFELTVSGAEATALRTALASVAAATGADIAVEQVGPGPAQQAADRARRRLHPGARRGHRRARRPGRPGGRGRPDHRRGDERRAGLRRVAARAGRRPGGAAGRGARRGARGAGPHARAPAR